MIAFSTYPLYSLRTLVSLFLLITAFLGSSNTIWAAELNVSKGQLPISLGLYLEHMEDPSGELDLDDVLQLKSQWQRSVQDVPTLGFSSSAHWFSGSITGNSLDDIDLAISINAPTLDRIEFFVLQDNEVVSSYLSGDTIPFSQQSVANRIPTFPIKTAEGAGKIKFYFRVSSQSGIEIPIYLTTTQQIVEEQLSQIAFFGGFFILFLVCFAMCWIIFYFQRDRQFLGYTIFFGSCIIFFLTITGMGKVWFWSESVELSNRLSYTSGCVLIASFCLLGQSLNLTGKLRQRVVIVLRFIAYAMIPTSLYFLFTPLSYITGSNIQLILSLGLAVSLVVFSMALVAAIQGSRVAFYLVITWGQLLLAYLSLLAYKFNLVEKSDLSVYVSEILVALSGITLILSLVEFVKSKNEAFIKVNLETKAKSDFLSNVSKEFLTPVHLILANSKRLMAVNANKLDQPTFQHMTTVIKQSEHLHNLINDLLEMAEIDSDSFEPQFELIEITQFLSDIKDVMTPAILEKGLTLETQFSSANLLVQTDKSRIQHILINLLTNAIKSTDEGLVTLGYKAIYYKRKLGVEIFISDTGERVNDDYRNRMFQEFSHDSDFTESNPTSTGLGMVIVKRIVEKLGGEIEFDSTKNGGNNFFVRLPLRMQKV